MNLTYSLQGAYMAGVTKHPQIDLKDIGIRFATWDADTINCQILLGGCENVPDKLPSYITENNIKVLDTCVTSD